MLVANLAGFGLGAFGSVPFGSPANFLYDGQYELGGLVFGTRDHRANPNPYLVETFDIEPGTLTNGSGGNLSQASGTTGVLTGDASYPNEDGTRFGMDFYTGMNLTFSINVWHKDDDYAYDDVAALKGVWRNKDIRQTSNTTAALRICRGGRTRLVYGRPRKFKETYGSMEQGWAPIDCQFQAIDESFYDDTLNQKVIGLTNPSVNGFSLPSAAPFRFSQFADAYTTVRIYGQYPTFPQFILYGPIVKPTISMDDEWKITLNMTLNYYDYVVIDPRPWVRTTKLFRNGVDEINASGAYTSDSPIMRQMALEPGTHNLIFGGFDPTQTAQLEVGWRNAYATP